MIPGWYWFSFSLRSGPAYLYSHAFHWLSMTLPTLYCDCDQQDDEDHEVVRRYLDPVSQVSSATVIPPHLGHRPSLPSPIFLSIPTAKLCPPLAVPSLPSEEKSEHCEKQWTDHFESPPLVSYLSLCVCFRRHCLAGRGSPIVPHGDYRHISDR